MDATIFFLGTLFAELNQFRFPVSAGQQGLVVGDAGYGRRLFTRIAQRLISW